MVDMPLKNQTNQTRSYIKLNQIKETLKDYQKINEYF